MEKIYGFDLYNKRTNKGLLDFFIDYLKFSDDYDKSNLDKRLDYTEDFIELVNKHLNDTIVIMGDYDVDGISASAIMYKGLKKYGAKKVVFMVPNRFKDGYGMNERLVREALSFDAKLIITVDNGIKAHEAIALARENGIDVVVTDHHLPDDIIPAANVVINSHIGNKMLDTEHICGAMIAYLLVKALLNITDDSLKEELFLAQMATIADVMPLVYENRYAIKKVISETRENNTTYNTGIDALVKELGMNLDDYSVESISFKIAPIINTPGRLEDAIPAFQLLTFDNYEDAETQAQYLIDKNDIRKQMLDTIKKEAKSKVIKDAFVNIIYISKAHEGLIGIVAGNLSEETDKPSFVFTDGEDGIIKGSGRSPKWCDLSTCTKEILEEVKPASFGGHANAMGLSFKTMEDLEMFKVKMNEVVSHMEREDEIKTYLRYPNNFKIKEVKDILDTLEPFGEGLVEPVFVVTTKDIIVSPLGKGHTKIKIRVGEELIEGLYFFHEFKSSGGYYNIYFKIHKEYSKYSRNIEYKLFIEDIKEYIA